MRVAGHYHVRTLKAPTKKLIPFANVRNADVLRVLTFCGACRYSCMSAAPSRKLAHSVDVISSIRARKYRYPPGPKPLPIIGNIHQLPQGQLGKWAQGLAKEYGEMFTIRLGGQTWVFVNSSRIVKDLLEKRAAVSPVQTRNKLTL
jgi:hypothetical protein